MSEIVYVNGDYVERDAARVSIFDRGYLFGDGVYEVVPVLGGRLIDKAPFLERLDRSLGELQIAWPCSREDYLAVHEALIARNGVEEGIVYSQVTRGVAPRDFAFPKDVPRSFVAFAQKQALVDNPKARTGVKVATVEDLRWKRRDIKSIALLAQCLAKQRAAESGAFEAWMVENGQVTEGSSSSAYIVKNDSVVTRPLSSDILPGIRRKVLLQLAAEHQIRIEQRPFTVEEAMAADEAFLTSASNFVLPVIEIDGHPVGGGTPGAMTSRLREIYIDAARREAGVS